MVIATEEAIAKVGDATSCSNHIGSCVSRGSGR
jgi:hypothetical protein